MTDIQRHAIVYFTAADGMRVIRGRVKTAHKDHTSTIEVQAYVNSRAENEEPLTGTIRKLNRSLRVAP